MPASIDHKTLSNCFRRIEELLDEEIFLLNHGMLQELDHLNLRKSHLLTEFSRLSRSYDSTPSAEIQTYLTICHRKAERNYIALGNYLRALDDLNDMIIDDLRRQESAGTYSRPVAMRQSGI